MEKLLIGNDQTILVEGLRDEITGDYINNATVTARVLKPDGNPVSGQSWPLELDYVADSDGVYRGNLEDGIALIAGTIYDVEITATASGDLVAFWKFKRLASYRQP